MVYPDAADENWAEGIGASADRLGINDVGFVKDIINKRQAELNIDPIDAPQFNQIPRRDVRRRTSRNAQ